MVIMFDCFRSAATRRRRLCRAGVADRGSVGDVSREILIRVRQTRVSGQVSTGVSGGVSWALRWTSGAKTGRKPLPQHQLSVVRSNVFHTSCQLGEVVEHRIGPKMC